MAKRKTNPRTKTVEEREEERDIVLVRRELAKGGKTYSHAQVMRSIGREDLATLLSGWDKAAEDAKRLIRRLELAIETYRQNKESGVPWPGGKSLNDTTSTQKFNPQGGMDLARIKGALLKSLRDGSKYTEVRVDGRLGLILSKYSRRWIENATESDIRRAVVS